MTETAIRTEALVKDYGRVRGLDGLDLEVRTGEVYGFLGPNGAGKTTTIRLLFDLIRPTTGSVMVLGLDPRADGIELRRRIGYLADDFVVDGRQTPRELLTYLANLRGGVSPAVIDELAQRLDLDLTRRIGALSRGNRQKVGVVQAFMHDPELFILDEPTSGLDPFLQQEFSVMVRQAVSEGRTVFMSSHVMGEVQRVADRVGIIRGGRLTTVEGVHELRDRAQRRIEIVFNGEVTAEEFSAIPGVSDVQVEGKVLTCRLDGSADALVKTLARHEVVILNAEEPDLEELFFDYYDRGGESVDA
ncbi:MAG TPA: ABC transporter ATP-binding protein [Acidimicrobiia bacterium]|nr:ABC transporter ATP-binding protein [Acidimicrobiia bacterium]